MNLKNVGADPNTLTKFELRESVRSGWGVIVASVVAILTAAIVFVTIPLAEESRLQIVQTAVGLHLASILVSVVKCVAASTLGTCAWLFFENTPLGRRTENDPLILVGFIVGFCIVFGVRA